MSSQTVPATTALAQPVPAPEVAVSDRVYVVPDPRARAVTVWLVVQAGCADEAGGECRGLAHYLEHLLFLNRGSDHSFRISIFGGGAANGFTTMKSTGYFQKFPADTATMTANLDKAFAHFAGLLTDVRADPANADRERNIVLQEYNARWGSNAYQRFAITRSLVLLPGDPLGQRVGGTPETIKDYALEAARAYHKTWYTKSNAVIVVHGPVDPAAIKPIAAKYLDPLPSAALPARTWAALRRYDPAIVRLDETDKDAKVVGVNLDKIVHFEEPGGSGPASAGRVLNAARTIVGAFLASSLPGSPVDTLLERDGLILQGRLSVTKLRTGTMHLSFWAEPAPGVPPERVVEAAQAYIGQLPSIPLDSATIERLKTRLANARDLQRQQPERTAEALVSWLGGRDSYATWTEREASYAAVTTKQVGEILRTLAKPGREVIGILRPATAAATAAGQAPAPVSPPSGPVGEDDAAR